MTEEELDNFLNAADNPNFVSGIYNYCDRWCERCQHTHKCYSYAMEQRDVFNLGKTDNLFEKVAKVFEATMMMLEKMAKEEGIDLTMSEEDYQEFEQSRADKKQAAKSHPLHALSMRYIDQVKDWNEQHESWLEEKSATWQQLHEMDLPKSNPQAEIDQFNNWLEIISWYNFMIHVKFMRALNSVFEIAQGEDEDWQHDEMNGTAKVAMIGTERSIVAWHQIMVNFPEQEEFILPILVQLSKITKVAEKTFPKAMQHIRPGLDE
ncbi:MAG: hypothetical protein AAF789_14675 [Bacteroidota bacterium]